MFPALAVAALLGATSAARADIPPPEAEACSGKAPGAACSTGSVSGTCGDGECSRATPDGMVKYSCFICLEGQPTPEPAKPAKANGGCSGSAAGSAFGLAALAALVGLRRRARA